MMVTDTLQNRLSSFFSEPVSEAWLGAIGHASALGRDVAAWSALPDEFEDDVDTVGRLDAAARRLAAASGKDDEVILAALRDVEDALRFLDSLLARL